MKQFSKRRVRLLLGLYAIAEVSPVGHRWTQTDIAAVCGVSLQSIQHYEYRALQKLKHRATLMNLQRV